MNNIKFIFSLKNLLLFALGILVGIALSFTILSLTPIKEQNQQTEKNDFSVSEQINKKILTIEYEGGFFDYPDNFTYSILDGLFFYDTINGGNLVVHKNLINKNRISEIKTLINKRDCTNMVNIIESSSLFSLSNASNISSANIAGLEVCQYFFDNILYGNKIIDQLVQFGIDNKGSDIMFTYIFDGDIKYGGELIEIASTYRTE